MDKIKEDIEKVNKSFEELTDKQKELEKQIEKISKDKKNIKSKLIDDKITNIDKYKKLNDEILKYITGDNSLQNLDKELHKLYNIAFHGIVHGRVSTNLELPNDMQKYDRGKNIWINTRGIAFKPNDSYYYCRTNNLDATKCYSSLGDIMKLIILRPNLIKYIKKEDKKEIFLSFHKCFSKWKYPQENSIKIKQDGILSIDEHISYSIGLKSLKLKELNEIEVSIYNFIHIIVKNKDEWGTGRTFNMNDKLAREHEFILSQFSDETYNKIEEFVLELKKIHEYNKKLFNKLREEISPHIMHRLI